MAKPDLCDYTTKELEAEVKRRRGYDSIAVDAIGAALPDLDLGGLGLIRRQANALWEHRMSRHTGLTDEEKALLASRDFLGCVKAVRDRLGIHLAEAKAFVDKWKGVP